MGVLIVLQFVHQQSCFPCTLSKEGLGFVQKVVNPTSSFSVKITAAAYVTS
jgi:NADH:ubiquinone oxidoreductase subunit F (NADH-binding)